MMKKQERSKEVEGKTINEVFIKENGCLIVTFTDGTCMGVYNKGEFTEECFELGIDIYK